MSVDRAVRTCCGISCLAKGLDQALHDQHENPIKAIQNFFDTMCSPNHNTQQLKTQHPDASTGSDNIRSFPDAAPTYRLAVAMA